MKYRTESNPEPLRRCPWGIAAALWVLMTAGLGLAAEPVRVQVTTGGHPYDMAFYGAFEGRSDLAITLNPHPSAYRRDLRKFTDVLVLYDLADVDDVKQRANIQAYLESGKGLVVLHHALARISHES